jgi:hypothetical protein
MFLIQVLSRFSLCILPVLLISCTVLPPKIVTDETDSKYIVHEPTIVKRDNDIVADFKIDREYVEVSKHMSCTKVYTGTGMFFYEAARDSGTWALLPFMPVAIAVDAISLLTFSPFSNDYCTVDRTTRNPRKQVGVSAGVFSGHMKVVRVEDGSVVTEQALEMAPADKLKVSCGEQNSDLLIHLRGEVDCENQKFPVDKQSIVAGG